MSLLSVVIVLIVAGVILYLVNRFVPMDAKIKTILNWVVIIFIVIWLLKALGALNWFSSITI